MFAIVRTGGKQYRVGVGDQITVERIAGDVGAEIELGDVLAIGGDETPLIGTPTVPADYAYYNPGAATLGPDGHTASLVPGDPVLDVDNVDVALSGPYQGRRRMTLTYPILNRARRILWVVTGGEKTGMVNRLIDGDRGIPAGRVCSARASRLWIEPAICSPCSSVEVVIVTSMNRCVFLVRVAFRMVMTSTST